MSLIEASSAASGHEHLDPVQLARLEQSFRDWVLHCARAEIRRSRKRILLIFLLVRYTGAKLNEALAMRPERDIDEQARTIFLGEQQGSGGRTVQVSAALLTELLELVRALQGTEEAALLAVDPAFVRRKFYERAQDCGFTKKQGGPEMIRKARALELIREKLPLPAVQHMLGLSTLDLASAHVNFSEQELQQATRWFVERESGRMTSARNAFFGKISAIHTGGVQSLIEISTTDGQSISSIVTNNSVQKMGLKLGRLVTAEIKAPWLSLERADRSGMSSADNMREGTLIGLTQDAVSSECIVQVGPGLELCAVVSTQAVNKLGLSKGERVRVLFSCYSVILQIDAGGGGCAATAS